MDKSTNEGDTLYTWAQENVFEIDSCPHEWLLPQCSVAVHHGGAGTLAAGLRAGRPTIVCATQGDQPFHGSLVQKRGIGKYLGMIGSEELTAESVATAISEVMVAPSITGAAKTMGEKIRIENGIADTISFIDKTAASYSYPWPTEK